MSERRIQVEIREATEADRSEVVAVFENAFEIHRDVYRPVGGAAELQDERFEEGTRLVALVDGQIVGTIQCANHSGHLHLIGFAVRPEFQRMGIGRRLIEEAMRLAPEMGHGLVVLETIRETGNVGIFEKMGFEVVGEKVADWCESERYEKVHDVRMERRVS